jgi:hypothetical protein
MRPDLLELDLGELRLVPEPGGLGARLAVGKISTHPSRLYVAT